MTYYGPEFEAYLRAERQARMAAAATAARNQQTVDSLNFTASQQAAKPWSEHQKYFDSFKQRQEAAPDDTREQAQKHWDEFQARLHRYRGPMEPLLDLLKIKSKNPCKAEIRTAYIAAVKRHHPDLGGSEEIIKQVNVAYELLLKRFR